MALTSAISDKWNSSSVSRIFDENFGMGLDFNQLRREFRQWIEKQSSSALMINNDSEAKVTTNNDKFEVTIDVHQFKSEEITIKVSGSNTISIEGTHEEQHNDCGFLSRHFVRKYTLPSGYDITNIVSSLSSDGVLRIIAPRSGQTIDDYRNVAIHQLDASLQNKKQTQYNENHVQKSVKSYNEVPIQLKEVSIVQNQERQMRNNKQQSHIDIQTSREFEETHKYIQQFLHDMENKFKIVPVRQVGPFSKDVQETQCHIDSIKSAKNRTLQQTEEKIVSETYKKQNEYRNVPIQQTTSSFDVESHQVHESQNHNVPIKSTKVNEMMSNEIIENKTQNRKYSIDKNEKYAQQDSLYEYRTVPIQQTGKPCGPAKEKDDKNISNTVTTPQTSRTVGGEQTGKEKCHVDDVQHRVKSIEIVEESKTWDNEQQHKSRTIPIEQTDIFDKSRGQKNSNNNKSNYEKTENWECNISETKNVANTSQEYKTIPIEQTGVKLRQELQEEKHVKDISYTAEQTRENHKQIEELSNYKAIPIEPSGIVSQIRKDERHEQKVFKNNSIDSQCNIKNTTDFEKTENWESKKATNTSQEFKTIPIDQKELQKSQNIQGNNMNATKRRELIEETTLHENDKYNYRTIPIEQTGFISQVRKDESHEQKIFKGNSIDSQCNLKNTTDFELTDKRVTNTSQEYKTIDIERQNKHESENHSNAVKRRELTEKTATLENDRYNYQSNPIEQSTNKDEFFKREINKNSSIDCQHNIQTEFEKTLNWESNASKTQKVDSTSQDYKTFQEQTGINLNANENIKSNKIITTQQELFDSKNASQSTNTEKRSSSQHLAETQNTSSLQINDLINSRQKNDLCLSTTQNQNNNMAFQENEYTKEEFERDGYKQSGYTTKNAKAECITYPQGFKVTNEQAFYSEQTKTKQLDSKNDKQVDQAQNNAYQVQFSVDSNSSERFCRRPSETSEICIEEITEENQEKTHSGVSSGYRKHETSQFSSNSDHTIHVQRN